MPKVSVIIPVYNAEKYLGECLDSVLGQTLKDIEVLCVDDGSTDGSARILADYAAKDARVRLFRTARAGAAVARNRGLAEATGEYLFFCDADDWIGRRALSAMYGRARQADADLAVTGLRYFDSGTGRTYRVWNPTARAAPFAPQDLGDNLFFDLGAQIGGKFVRRQFVLDAGLSFQEQPRANDVAFVAVACATARRIVVDGEAHYHYRKNHGGNLSAGVNEMPDMAARAWVHVKGELERRGTFEPFRRAFMLAASQALVNSLLAITDASSSSAFFRKVREELMPALGLLRAESVDDARVFFEDEGPLQLFIDRLAEMRRRYAEQKAREFAWRLHPIRSFFWWLRRHFP